MARVYFPTRNDNGVRDLSKSVTLGAYIYDGYRGPAEPAAKAAMNPVTLGAVVAAQPPNAVDYVNMIWRSPDPIWMQRGPSPIPFQRLPYSPGRPAPPTIAPPVSQQSTPTPQVTAPGAPPTSVLVSSGGGTASPGPATPPPPYVDANGNTWIYNASTGQWVMAASASGAVSPAAAAAITPSPTTSTVVTAAPGLTDQVAAWLGGTTPIGTWNVPNALLAAGVALGAALFMGGGKKR